MATTLSISLWNLVLALSSALDLVSPAVASHHRNVAYIAHQIGLKLLLPREEASELAVAGALHDIGALSLEERLDLLEFEGKDPHLHAERGAMLLGLFSPLARQAELVRFHHVSWDSGRGSEFAGSPVPFGSHILHLADRVALLVDKAQEPLGQVKAIRDAILAQSGRMFMPDHVDAFMALSKKECFWLDLGFRDHSDLVRPQSIQLQLDALLELARLFSYVIDFRSRFTATHSAGVATIAEALARLVGFSKNQCLMMKVAGYLHDLGKLAVPPAILEKPAKLTEEEFNVMRAHTYYTYRALEPLADFETINTWASYHHERLNGNGYPFHLTGPDLSLGARIMAVADVFTAITEDRPYRKAMTDDKALGILQSMVQSSVLAESVVSLLAQHFEELNALRRAAQTAAVEAFKSFYSAGSQSSSS